jgi:hypothetical protein
MRTPFRKILSKSSVLARAALALLATAIFATSVFAEPPSRVGRVSLVEGNVSFFMDRSEGWKPARINFPVTSENSLWTEGASRAEVRIGPLAMRLDDNTILDFVRIDDDQTQAYLQRGSINIRTRRDGDNDRETLSVETADGRFVVEGNGRYRIDAADNGAESRISVYSGRARFEATDNSANSVTVDRGRTLVVQGRSAGQAGANSFRFETAAESGFDRWADARDRTWDRTHTRYVSSQVVSSYMTGYEELDTHGDWVESGEYGRVWAPRYVSSGWAPYRHGSWSYVNPWGWTWVDEAPWGFAPFHYGRWVTIGSRWHWWPGAYQRRPAYAPALVAWYGQPGLSVNVSVGSPVGWFPLAPHEHYAPRYTRNVNHIRNVNHVHNHVTIINNNPPARYRNQVPGATFVNQNVFVQSKPIAANVIRESRANLANFKPVQEMNIPRPVVQGQPAMSGQPSSPQQQGNGNANSVWARGRNNVAPVYVPQIAPQIAPQMQGQGQVQGQAQVQQGQDRGPRAAQGQVSMQGGQIQPQQNQIPGRVGGEVAQGAAPGMPGGNNNVQPGRGGANRDTPPAINAAPVMNGGVQPNPQGSSAKPMQVTPPPQPIAQPAPQPVAVQPRVGGAQNVVPPTAPAPAPPSPAPIAVQSQQRPPVVIQSAQPPQPQPAYVQARPNAVNAGEQAEQPRVRPNRAPEANEQNGNFRIRPQREIAPQNIPQNVPQNVVPQQRNEQRMEQRIEQRIERQAPQPRMQQQPQPQPRVQQQPQPQQQPPQQPRPQGQPQPVRPEKPQAAPRVEGQGKPLQQQQ